MRVLRVRAPKAAARVRVPKAGQEVQGEVQQEVQGQGVGRVARRQAQVTRTSERMTK